MRECYGKLKELLVCGYPLTLLRLKTEGFDLEYFSFLSQAETYLNARDFDGFARAWSAFMAREDHLARAFIESRCGA